MAKRRMRRARKTKRKMFRRKRSMIKRPFQQDPCVKIETELRMIGSAGELGVKGLATWGAINTSFVPGWSAANIIAYRDSSEAIGYFNTYTQYKIVGLKLKFVCGEFIGDQDDARVILGLHIGSTITGYSDPSDVTVARLQKCKDYGFYKFTSAAKSPKRYYKVSARNARQNQILWQDTADNLYSNAITYWYLEVEGASASTAWRYGKVIATYFVKFRNKLIT